jgi:LPXTG-motif cell wall-anchored protein
MKRNVIFVVVLAFSVLIGVQAVEVADANPDSTGSINFHDSALTIFSPLNTTYNDGNLILNVTVPIWSIMGMPNSVSMNYSIDGIYNGQVPLRDITPPDAPPIATKAGMGAGRVNMPELPDGSHYLTIYLYGLNMMNHQPQFKTFIYTVFFSIDDPNSIFSPTPNPTNNPALLPTVNNGPHVNYGVNPLPYVIGITVIGTAIIGGLLVYFRKRKEKL